MLQTVGQAEDIGSCVDIEKYAVAKQSTCDVESGGRQ